jgi:hypothetical protein
MFVLSNHRQLNVMHLADSTPITRKGQFEFLLMEQVFFYGNRPILTGLGKARDGHIAG